MRRITPYLILLLCLVFVGTPLTAAAAPREAADQTLGIRTDQVSDGDLYIPLTDPPEGNNDGDRTVGDDDAPGETVKTNSKKGNALPTGCGLWLVKLHWCWIIVI